MAEFYLLRHARTAGNERGIYLGRTDEPLSEKGKAELLRYAPFYPMVEAVYVSPLRRCRETAAVLYPGKPQIAVEALREYDFGAFEGKAYEQLKDDPAYRAWIDAEGRAPIPDGEEFGAFQARCVAGFESIVADVFEKGCASAAIVAHGGTIMAIMGNFASDKNGLYGWKVKNCEGVRLGINHDLWKKRRTFHRVASIPV